jgi:hypothetical protein
MAVAGGGEVFNVTLGQMFEVFLFTISDIRI